ncbi:MAG: JDVT-CTERM domain-containing protein, partial [Gammaproteobacteria bacterium]
QLLEDGTIIFGYNGIAQTVSQTADILVGLSPGNVVADPGNTDFIATVPFDSMLEPTIYQLFSPPQDFDLDDTNLVFTPNGNGGFNVDDTLPDPPPSNAPPTWESALGATIRGAGAGLDDTDDATITRTFGSLTFPFHGMDYTGASILAISSNGFISLGGDNGTGCINTDCSGDPQQLTGLFLFPTIAPLWTDLEPGPGGGGDIYYNEFNDDADPAIDRIVITFANGFHDCVDAACSALAQLQLLGQGNKYARPAGTIIFGYNGIVQTNSQLSSILAGVSPGNNTVDPGSTNLNARSSFNTGTESTVYQLFVASSPPPIDLDGANVVFEPNSQGGFVVSTPGSGGSGTGGGGGGGGGCTMQTGNPADPLFPAVLSGLTLAYALRRRHKSAHQRVHG